jgi:carbamoyl-phosphate synthase small subunit
LAKLILSDEQIYEGLSFGDTHRDVEGEVVFNTNPTGYVETLTDPSYRGQIIVFAYPMIGNYGVPEKRLWESSKIYAAGVVVGECCFEPSHADSEKRLDEWLYEQKVPGIYGVDTRSIITRIRTKGATTGTLLTDCGKGKVERTLCNVERPEAIYDVEDSPFFLRIKNFRKFQSKRKVGLYDLGCKASIAELIMESGAAVEILPHDAVPSEVDCDAFVFSNGSGDPKGIGYEAATRAMSALIKDDDRPAFGICLGCQIMALAAGGDTKKMKFGHRSVNQPVAEERPKGRFYVTSQNHGFEVDRMSLVNTGFNAWMSNCNDDTVEGIESASGKFRAVQFHPEARGGPRDSENLLREWLDDAVRNT